MKKINNDIYNFLIQNHIDNTPNLNSDEIKNWGDNLNNVYEHDESYLQNIQQNQSPGPIEKHPYLDLFSEDCDFNRGFLILGTFPPSSYFNNLQLINLPNPNIQNNIPLNYYYGNMNTFWFYLFGLPDDQVTVENIRCKMQSNNLSISDVFFYCQRKIMSNAVDGNLWNIVVNCKLQYLFNIGSKIDTILFTSGDLHSFFGVNTSALTGFKWILEECCGGLDQFQINGDIAGNGDFYSLNTKGVDNALMQQNNGIVWRIKFKKTNKIIRIINLPSPANTAAQAIPRTAFFLKWINYTATMNGIQLPNNDQLNNLMEYSSLYPEIFTQPITRTYRSSIYGKVLNNTIHEII